MTKLVKNELIKVFSKKAIYVLAIITLLITGLSTFIINSFDSVQDLEINDEIDINDYDLNDKDDRTYYIDAKTQNDLNKEKQKYGSDTWQAYVLDNKAESLLKCINEFDLNKNEEEKNKCLDEYNKLLKEINDNDAMYFVKQEIKEIDEEIKEQEELLSVVSDIQKEAINKELINLKYKKEGLNYHLNKNIPKDYSDISNLIENYVDNAIEYQSLESDESRYTNRDDLIRKREVEKKYLESKYILDNDIKINDSMSAIELIKLDSSNVIFLCIIASVMIAGSIMSEELNKGTIKQLLLRPYTRGQILLSKIIASFIVFILFISYYYLIDVICYGTFLGFDSISTPIIIYDYSIKAIREVSLFSYCFTNLLALLPYYLIIMLVAFMMGTISGNTSLAIVSGFACYIVGSIVNSFVSYSKLQILKYLPTMCWDLTPYLYGGMSSYQYGSFTTSLIVSIITIAILIFASYIIFKRKNIKNQ